MSRQKALYHLERYFRLAYAANPVPKGEWLMFSCVVKVEGDMVNVGAESLIPMPKPEPPPEEDLSLVSKG